MSGLMGFVDFVRLFVDGDDHIDPVGLELDTNTRLASNSQKSTYFQAPPYLAK